MSVTTRRTRYLSLARECELSGDYVPSCRHAVVSRHAVYGGHVESVDPTDWHELSEHLSVDLPAGWVPIHLVDLDTGDTIPITVRDGVVEIDAPEDDVRGEQA